VNVTGKPRRGTLEPAGRWPDGAPRFRFRLRLGDGTKSQSFDVPQGLDEKKARTFVSGMQAQEDARGEILAAKLTRVAKSSSPPLPAPGGETMAEWFDRYLVTLECGEAHRKIAGYEWRKWIAPVLGPLRPTDVTRDRVEDVRDKLDAALDAGELRHATAQNVWNARFADCSRWELTRTKTKPVTMDGLRRL